MGKHVVLGDNNEIFSNEDKGFDFEVLTTSGTPVNVSGWTLYMKVSRTKDSAAVLSGTATISGTYNATRANNAQRASVDFTAAQTSGVANGEYLWSVKRTDSGFNTILGEGPFFVERTNQ